MNGGLVSEQALKALKTLELLRILCYNIIMLSDAKATPNVTELQDRIAELEALVKYYEEQLRLATHRQFGTSSEKDEVPEQLNLFNEAEAEADLTHPEPELEQITYTRRRQKGKREDALSGLPIEAVVHTLPEEEQVCPECDGPLHVMGKNLRRELPLVAVGRGRGDGMRAGATARRECRRRVRATL